MARYTGPVCRMCRREKEKLFLKGEKCYSDKCPMNKDAKIPGPHWANRTKLTTTVFSSVKNRRLRDTTECLKSSSLSTSIWLPRNLV